MAELSLTNKVDIAGNYGDASNPITFSSNDVTTTLIQGLTVTKNADKTYWVNGPLTYTLTITNNSGGKLDSGVITDKLDTNLISLDETYGVLINGSKTEDYTYTTGTLTVNLPELADSSTTTVTFQVNRVS